MEDRTDISVVGVYLEGFGDLDGLEALRSIKRLTSTGKSVVFYKAGRTETGRSAAAGHTAAVAGDYDICMTALLSAGAIVAETFEEFNQAIDIETCLLGKQPSLGRVFAVTNAGMEAVAMADTGLKFSALDEGLRHRLAEVLQTHRLDKLVSPKNPLDLTPTASEVVFHEVVCAALESEEVDAVIVSCVPLAPSLRTLESDLGDPESFVQLAEKWASLSRKPIVFSIDGGTEYDALCKRIRDLGVPMLRSCDLAAKLLSRWCQAHKTNGPGSDPPQS